jgi:hypothetical protein
MKRDAPVKFVIVMPMARVGSNLLFGNLVQRCGTSRTIFKNENVRAVRDARGQREWLRDFYAAGEGYDVIGSKQSLDTIIEPSALADAACEHAVALIRMRRANILKVAVSGLRARIYAEKTKRETGVALWGVESEHEPLAPVALDPQQFLTRAAAARLADERLTNFSPATATLDVEYRDLQQDPVQVTRTVSRWLGLPDDGEIRSRFTKATPDDLSLAVPNLGELRAALRRSDMADLEPMLDE